MNMIEAMDKSAYVSLDSYLVLAKEGLLLEFGVASGGTINRMAEAVPGRKFYGFDSFEGLPEDWRPGIGAGTFRQEQLPPVLENVELVVGLFSDSLPKFLEEHKEPIAFVHIDCDLYSSTKCVFDLIKDRCQDGTIIAFDEIRNYPGYEEHEYKAFNEFLEQTGYQWECIGHHGGEQAAFVIYN